MVLGILLRRVKRRRESRDALGTAHETFSRIGARAWADRASIELARISGRTPRARGLTATEEQVAHLVAAGRANKEVAAEVHLSVKAVEANLSRVYRKLDVRSRSELAARLGGR
jgi:DNA-binding NarL/FixJ family response regulator